MEKKKLGIWVPVLVIAAALLMLAVSTGTVDAARGGARGGGKPGGSTATLTVTPNPVLVGSPSIVISGSGFGSNENLEVGVMGMIPSSFLTTDSNGNFSTTYSPWGGFSMEGTGTAVALKNRGHTLEIVASATFRVCSTIPCQ